MRCPECQKITTTVKDENGKDVQQPQASSVEQVSPSTVFAAPLEPLPPDAPEGTPTKPTFKHFYDAKSQHHVHDNSITETIFKCSMGHTFEVCDPTTVCHCGWKPDVAALKAMREQRDEDKRIADEALKAQGVSPQPNAELPSEEAIDGTNAAPVNTAPENVAPENVAPAPAQPAKA